MTEAYQLIDFGRGRKLERFGPWLLDRPAPSAETDSPAHPEFWSQATARFEIGGNSQNDARGTWQPADAVAQAPVIELAGLRFELKTSPFGHVGLFPEHAANWDWIAAQVAAAAAAGQPLKVLNLFAYTGGTTLAAARAGAEVTHVDAARNVVAWARRNAAGSGLGEAAIRWIAEDAVRFVKRELRRGNRYDAVVLDPPSYGHGPRGEVWRLSTGLKPLLERCHELTAGHAAFVVLTCHTPGYDPPRLAALVDELMPSTGGRSEAFPLVLTTPDGRPLASGAAARRASAGNAGPHDASP